MEKIKSCQDCANFEEIYGVPVCARIHTLGITCNGFRTRLRESRTLQQKKWSGESITKFSVESDLTHNPLGTWY